jgi:hypothetical protein
MSLDPGAIIVLDEKETERSQIDVIHIGSDSPVVTFEEQSISSQELIPEHRQYF